MRILPLSALVFFLSSGTVQAIPASDAGPPQDCHIGFQSLEAERYDDAVNQLGKCLQLNLSMPARALVLRVRAEAYREIQRPDLAVQDAQSAMQVDKPKDSWPWISLGYYYRDLKQYDKALEALKEALKYDEDGAGTGPGMAVHYHTGWTLHEAGRYAEAIEAYTRGIPRQPDYGAVYYRRALAHEALGNREQARQDLLKAQELSPQEGIDAELIAKLIEYGILSKTQPR